MSWDCIPLSRDEHLDRLRTHHGELAHILFPEDAEVYEWKFGENGQEGYDMQELGGVEGVIYKGSPLFYLGRATHKAEDPVFEVQYDSDEDLDDEDVDVEEDVESRSINDDLEPEDPNALAPQSGGEIWLMVAEEIVAVKFFDIDGKVCWRVYVMGRSFVSKGYMFAKHRKRSARVKHLLNNMHSREHVKSDRWDVCRLHNVLCLVALWPLNTRLWVIPPPSDAAPYRRAWYVPGCLHNADKRIQNHNHKPLVFRPDNAQGPAIECAAQVCKFTHRAYNRAKQTIAACTWCVDREEWYHVDCLKKAPRGAVEDEVSIESAMGVISAPLIRRGPSADPKIMKAAARGVLLRADCPVRSWERLALAVHEVVTKEDEGELEEAGPEVALLGKVQQSDKVPMWRSISRKEADSTVMRFLDNTDTPFPLLCPHCGRIM